MSAHARPYPATVSVSPVSRTVPGVRMVTTARDRAAMEYGARTALRVVGAVTEVMGVEGGVPLVAGVLREAGRLV